MRTLTSTLLSAQQSSSRLPFVRLVARNNLSGVVNLRYERLYTGPEMDSACAITLPGDGSLIRVRCTPAGDGRKLYYSRVGDAGPGSNYSFWDYITYNVMAVAACSQGANVSFFYVLNTGEIVRYYSSNYGVSWSADYPGYAPTGDVLAMAAAYQDGGDMVLFFTDTDDVCLIKFISGVWGSRLTWDKTTGPLSGLAAVYDGDFMLLVSGQDSSGDYKVWSLVYGCGDEVPAGTWSDLKEITSAPYGGSFEYKGVFLDKPDTLSEEGQGTGVYRCTFLEQFTGSQAYSRPFTSHSIPDTSFLDNRWREPVPFNLESEYGLAMAHYGDYSWLVTPSGVWRASHEEITLELTSDILSVMEEAEEASERLVVELRNDSGQYAAPGEGDLAVLDHGCQLDFSPGYVTPEGDEYSEGLSFTLQGYEHTSSPGRASLILYAAGGWDALEKWKARYQVRWNKRLETGESNEETTVKEILAQVLARAGIRLEIVSESAVMTGFYPDFTIHPGDNGRSAVTRLLSFVPDVLFIEGLVAYLVNPLPTQPSVYSYGGDHVIQEGRYRHDSWNINRVLVEGLDPAGPTPVVVESFEWDEVQKVGDRLEMVDDLNVDSVARGEERGEAFLRQSKIHSVSGFIRAPVNCGQQMYDVIDITDSRAGLAAAKRRIIGISLSFSTQKGQYEHVFKLGEV